MSGAVIMKILYGMSGAAARTGNYSKNNKKKHRIVGMWDGEIKKDSHYRRSERGRLYSRELMKMV